MTSEKAAETAARIDYHIANANHPAYGVISSVYNSGTQTIDSTTPYDLGATINLRQQVTGGSGQTWRFLWTLLCVPTASGSGGSSRFRLQGPGFGTYSGYWLTSIANGPATVARYDNTSGFNVFMTGPVMSSSIPVYVVQIGGRCTFTGNGWLTVEAALTGSGDCQYVIAGGSSMDLWQIPQ